MIVVAIIGILAAVAIPQYQNYTVKAKIANALTAAETLKKEVALCAQETGALTDCDGGSNGITANDGFTATKEVASATTTNGAVALTLRSGIKATTVDGLVITMTPTVGNTGITWCNTTTVTDATALALITKNNIASCT